MLKILAWIGIAVLSLTGLSFIVVAGAAWNKTHDAAIIRNGFAGDYTSLAVIMGIVGVPIILAAAFLAFLVFKRKAPPKPDSHF